MSCTSFNPKHDFLVVSLRSCACCVLALPCYLISLVSILNPFRSQPDTVSRIHVLFAFCKVTSFFIVHYSWSVVDAELHRNPNIPLLVNHVISWYVHKIYESMKKCWLTRWFFSKVIYRSPVVHPSKFLIQCSQFLTLDNVLSSKSVNLPTGHWWVGKKSCAFCVLA